MRNQCLGFVLENEEKVHRAIYGTVGREGKYDGGVGEKSTDEELIAEYDRLGGLITKNGYKVKTGCFYNFDKKQPRAKFEVVFVFRDIVGDEVEVPEGESLPLEVRAVELKKTRGRKPKKPVTEPTSDEDVEA